MSLRIRGHPRFDEFRDWFRGHPQYFVPWHGTLFRFQTVDFPASRAVLSGEGARVYGGRWNPPGFAALYGSTDDATALAECKAHDRYYGVATKSPRLLVAFDAKLARVLDLTQPTTRRAMRVTLKEFMAEDWRKALSSGRESFTQALGRAVHAAGGSGIIVRSAVVRRGINGIVFPGNLPKDELSVVGASALERLAPHLPG